MAAVVPARDAGHLLGECVQAILGQSAPPDEVWLVIGPSGDNTAAVARRLASGAVGLLDNPAGDRGSAINAALAKTDADVIAMVDAQSRLEPDYLETALRTLTAAGVSVVGGPMRAIGRTAVGHAMAAALRSPIGVGDSQFHFEGPARDVESVYLGVYRAGVFSTVGQYNPALLRTEDDDMNARLRAAGHRIRLDPAIRSTYLCRNDLPSIWRQYFGYGYWKVALAAVRPDSIRLRHAVPAAFVLAVVGSLVVSATLWVWFAPIVLGAYLSALLVGAVLASDLSLRSRLIFPVVVATMHVSYGLGTLVAALLWRSVSRRVRRSATAVEHRASS